MIRVINVRLFSLAVLAALAACSGGSDTGGIKTGGDFLVLKTEPEDNATLFLNDPIRIDFSNPVDLGSVDLSTFTFEVRDQFGNVVSEPVAGRFELSTSPGDAVSGRRLLFLPRLPTNDQYSNGGFRPGREYRVQLVGGNTVTGTMMRDQNGRGLAFPKTFRFVTADGTTPSQLFRNTALGGPARTAFEISPAPDQSGVVLNKLGTNGIELRLRFNQPLNPSSLNVPVSIPIDPLTRSANNRGRIFLEYDDPELGEGTWIPADAELEENSVDGATVVLRPLGVLPNNAQINVIVERTLEDIAGESNVSSGGVYNRVFATFRTKRAYEQQFDGIVESFTSSGAVDFAAAFPEPVAEVGPGYIKAGFAFEGTTTGAEFEPTVQTTVLNTNFTQVTPKQGAPFNVSGGVFNFKNVKIPTGKKVIGQGSNPMIWLVSGSFEVAGELSVRGGNGVIVGTSGTANVPKAGGAGVCSGGDGGDGSPSATIRDVAGETGNGPRQLPGGGGVGGDLSCLAGCNRGAGGGGGSMSTQGDPKFKQKIIPPTTTPFPSFQQQQGLGGNGCSGVAGAATRVLQGAVPGPMVFTDASFANNFWGVGLRFDGKPLRIVGELSIPVGGGGGGGGGDLAASCDIDDVNFEADSSGGGGGGGGGVLVVKALGPIIIAEGGSINADGGSGGGGEPSGSSGRGGGGGGGAGGMVVLMSATRIDINARGANNRFLYGATGADNNDYNFSISADGGSCVTGNFTAPIVLRKYVPDATGAIPASFATLYDSAPLGGFGGMGVVQLMTPPGNNTDGTNTRLDDNINFYRATVLQTGAAKQALIAWRGFPNQLGQGVDDAGQLIPTTFTGTGNPPPVFDIEGDIRPAPVLLPVPFGSVSRLRSQWIDTGASKRRALAAGPDELPRGVDTQGNVAQAGPRYEFSGVQPANGFVDYAVVGTRAVPQAPIVVTPASIVATSTNVTYLGEPAYRVQLTTSALGTVVDRYSQYEAEVLNAAGAQVGSFRILTHTGNEVTLSAESGTFPAAAAQMRVRAKLFDVWNGSDNDLGPTYISVNAAGNRVPVANVRIGFAFHQDPASSTATRFPAGEGNFAYDLSDPAVQEQIRLLGAAFVQWDVTFDTTYRTGPAAEPNLPVLSPDTRRPELRFLRLPFRF